MEGNAQYFIGTSGWSYFDWKGIFYPESIKNLDMLSFYASKFNTVELNSSFYHLPNSKTVEKWYAATPANFVFSCKASRYLTHVKKLSDHQSGLTYLFKTFDGLKEKLGPILFQLPPRWGHNQERLNQFLNALSKDYQYTFEFRDQSWLCEEVYALLKKHQIALCLYDYKGYQAPEILTANFVYVRLHGPEKNPYYGSYPEDILKRYAKKISCWKNTEVTKIYCYFDNDVKAAAPHDAKILKKMIEIQ